MTRSAALAVAAGLVAGLVLASGSPGVQAAAPAEVPLPPRRPPDLGLRAVPPLPAAAAEHPLHHEVFGPTLPPRTAHPAVQVSASAADTCTDTLKSAGVVFTTAVIGPQPDPQCVVANPVTLTGLDAAEGLPIDFPDRPTIGCVTAQVFASYLRTLLVPLARGQFGSSIAAVGTGPGFDCRTRDHIPGAKISAHGLGLAVDIAEIRLANGRRLDIGHPADAGERAFDTGARAGACGFFHTALGPGADSFHETHWHFDLLPRGAKGDSRICQ